jgi:hypothetical protein
MHNVRMNVKGKTLIIEVDLSQPNAAPRSKTGKTRLLASTAGAVEPAQTMIPGLKVALNVMIPVAFQVSEAA